MHSTSTAEDGTFRIVTIPGPVLLMGGVDYDWSPAGQAYPSLKYKRATADPRYPQYFPADHPGAYASADGGFASIARKLLQGPPDRTGHDGQAGHYRGARKYDHDQAPGRHRPPARQHLRLGRRPPEWRLRRSDDAHWKPIHGWPRAWPSQANRGAWSSTNPARSCSPRSRSRATRKGLWSCGCSPVALFGEPSSTGPASP